MRLIQAYRATSSTNETFYVAEVTPDNGDGVVVMSNRSGTWAKEPLFHSTDLTQPSQQLFPGWNIESIDVKKLPKF